MQEVKPKIEPMDFKEKIKDFEDNLSFWKKVYYWFCRRYNRIKDFFSEIKYFFQRLFKGYDDTDEWSLYGGIVRRIRKPLKAFVKYNLEHGAGCPSDLYDHEAEKKGEDACKAWREILGKIDLAFDLLVEDEYATDAWFKKTTEEHIEDNKKMQEGLEFFGKYFRTLWD